MGSYSRKRQKKLPKKLRKLLDKPSKVWYTKYVIKGRKTLKNPSEKGKDMTNREFFTAILNSNLSDEMKEHATAELKKMDERNSKRSSTMTTTQKENIALKEKILSALTTEGKVASALAEELNLSVQKVSSLCRQLVEEGKVTVEDVKIPKKGKQKSYKVKEVA